MSNLIFEDADGGGGGGGGGGTEFFAVALGCVLAARNYQRGGAGRKGVEGRACVCV